MRWSNDQPIFIVASSTVSFFKGVAVNQLISVTFVDIINQQKTCS